MLAGLPAWFSEFGIYIGLVLTVPILLAVWWWLPRAQANRLRRTVRDPKARAELEDNFRKTIGQLGGGIAVLLGIAFAYSQTIQTLREAEKSRQATDTASRNLLISQQVSKGFDQLGSDKINIRIGGVYALEGVMNVSADYHRPIMEALCAFVRQTSYLEGPRNGGAQPEQSAGNDQRPRQTSKLTGTKRPNSAGTRPDVEAAVTALGRRFRNFKEGILDLSGSRLQGAFLSGTDLSGGNLTLADLSTADLTEANLSNSNLSRASLLKTNLSKANLSGARLSGANLAGAELVGALLSEANLARAVLVEADLDKANLVMADLQDADLSLAILNGAKLSQARLRGANLFKGTLWSVDLSGADLSHANATRAVFNEATLVGTIFSKANLSNARLRGANLSHAMLAGTVQLTNMDLSGADLTKAEMFDSTLSESDLSRTHLLEADLSLSRLIKVNLSKADLTGANLTGADLTGANLSGANLSGAILWRAESQDITTVQQSQLNESCGNSKTQLPPGYTIPACQ